MTALPMQPLQPLHDGIPSLDQRLAATSMLPRNHEYPGIEDYHILEKLGDGAFSTVYRARHRFPQQRQQQQQKARSINGRKSVYSAQKDDVAIKIVRRTEMTRSQQANIYKEVQIMRMLASTPHVVQLIDFIETGPYFYLILNCVNGGELFNRIVDLTYFSEDLSRHVIMQVGEAVRRLHAKGIVHRDIKPENILFEHAPFVPSHPSNPEPRRAGDETEKRPEGKFTPGVGGGGIGLVKLADFGLSKVVNGLGTSTPCGTVGYAAPEVVRDELYTKAVDMWALGCVLYTMLCGFPPFYDEDVQVLTRKVARGEYSFLSPWWDDISPEARDLVSCLLTLDPRRRYDINDFFNHPWIQAANAQRNQSQQSDPRLLAEPARNPAQRQGATPSVDMRECFNLSFAVRRLEINATARREYMQTPAWERTFGQTDDYGFDGYMSTHPKMESRVGQDQNAKQQQQQQQKVSHSNALPISPTSNTGRQGNHTTGACPRSGSAQSFESVTVVPSSTESNACSSISKYLAQERRDAKVVGNQGRNQVFAAEEAIDAKQVLGWPPQFAEFGNVVNNIDSGIGFSAQEREEAEAEADWRYLNSRIRGGQQQHSNVLNLCPAPNDDYGQKKKVQPYYSQMLSTNDPREVSSSISSSGSMFAMSPCSSLDQGFDLQLDKATLINRRYNRVNNKAVSSEGHHRRRANSRQYPMAIPMGKAGVYEDDYAKPSSYPF